MSTDKTQEAVREPDTAVDYDEIWAGVTCYRSGVDGCPPCGKVDITRGQYTRQMHDADTTWFCPNCGGNATFDDARYEELLEARLERIREAQSND